MSIHKSTAHVQINDLISKSKLILQIVTDQSDFDETYHVDRAKTIYVKLNRNDGKFVHTVAGLKSTEWCTDLPVIVQLTHDAAKQLQLMLSLKHELGIRVRYVVSKNENYIDLSESIGNFNRVISNLNDFDEDLNNSDIIEFQELSLSSWTRLIPCESQPHEGYDFHNLLVRLTILFSALQKWSDHAMSETDVSFLKQQVMTYEVMFDYFCQQCLKPTQLQENLESLDLNRLDCVVQHSLLLLGSIQIRLHTNEQIESFILQKEHVCIMKSGCTLNQFIKIRSKFKGILININLLMKNFVYQCFTALTDFNSTHIERFLDLNLLTLTPQSLQLNRSEYFQMFIRISQIQNLFTDLPKYYKFNEVQHAQRFLSTLDK